MNVKVGDVMISIDLKQKLYVFSTESAIGKSYLYDLLKAYNKYENRENFLCITYDDNITTALVIDKIRSYEGPLILLDRFDKYFDWDIISVLYEKNIPTLIDMKNKYICNYIICETVYSSYERNHIEIREIN